MLEKQNLVISKMNILDLEEIKDTLLNDFDDFWNYEIFKEEIVNTNSYYLVLRYNNEIVCFGGYKKIIDTAEIMNIVTKKDFRNNGFAKFLLINLINFAKKDNIVQINLEVNESNSPAIHLYENLNFQTVGNRKNYYNGIDNAILMTLNL